MTPAFLTASSAHFLSRRRCLGLATAGFAAPWLQACGGGESSPRPPQADTEAVRWCREAILKTLHRSGSATTAISVALLADDRVVWREAFGYANRESGLLASTDTRFNLGSIAKIFATLSVMILRDRKLLSLDQPLVELVPAFRMLSPGFTRITVRHLLSHASGVPGVNNRNLFNFAPVLDYAQDTMKALAQSHLKHEPGELAVYCNDGFTLVEPLVTQLTGLSFPAFAQREILDPLGMSLSGYPLSAAPEGSFVHPYHQGQRMPQEMAAPFASGGIFSTPTDMMKLARLFLDEGVYEGRRIVSAEAVREMGFDQSARTRINPTPKPWRWGLGWDSVRQLGMDAAGLRGQWKNGATFFFDTEFFVLPEARLAMLISGSGFDYGSMALAEGLLLRAAAERGTIRALPPAMVPVVPPEVLPAPGSASLAGVYANYNKPLQLLAESDGSLTLLPWSERANQWDDAHAMRLRARSDGNWWPDGNATTCVRFLVVQGRRYLIERSLAASQLYWNETPAGEQLPPLAAPLPAAWRARVGSRWRCANESPDSVTSRLGPVVWRMGELQALPGYVLLTSEQPPGYDLLDCGQLLRVVNDYEAGMTVKIPGNAGRDLFELRMVTVNGREELHSGSLVFQRILA